MSAQVTRALRERAAFLAGDGDRLEALAGTMTGDDMRETDRDAGQRRWLAREFTKLADACEREP